MSYDASSRTFHIMPSRQVRAQSYIIEISLSDSFTEENIYWFTVRILPLKNEEQMNSKIAGPTPALANFGKISP
jgi:hypothetical protein